MQEGQLMMGNDNKRSNSSDDIMMMLGSLDVSDDPFATSRLLVNEMETLLTGGDLGDDDDEQRVEDGQAGDSVVMGSGPLMIMTSLAPQPTMTPLPPWEATVEGSLPFTSSMTQPPLLSSFQPPSTTTTTSTTTTSQDNNANDHASAQRRYQRFHFPESAGTSSSYHQEATETGVSTASDLANSSHPSFLHRVKKEVLPGGGEEEQSVSSSSAAASLTTLADLDTTATDISVGGGMYSYTMHTGHSLA